MPMNWHWEYLVGVFIILVLIYMAYAIGHLRGEDLGHKRGYQKGYKHGEQDAVAKNLSDPFVARPQFPALPRPNSAGTVRTHKAKIRGDKRPYSQRPDQLIYPRTKMVRPEDLD
jgi:hypothetical protein